MRILVVFAHPLNDSFNAALHRTVVTPEGIPRPMLLPGVSIILEDGKVRPALFHLNRRRFLARVDTHMRRFGR
jgi:hypothetical protein